MTNQRDRLGTEPGIGPADSVAPVAPSISESESASPVVYQEPTPVPLSAEPESLDLPTVQLAREIDIDPRRLPTELKLRPVVSSLAPPPSDPIGWEPVFELRPGQRSDSGWPPPETVVTTSQRPGPIAAPRSVRAQLALALLLGALLLLVLARAAMHRFQAPTTPTVPAAAALPPNGVVHALPLATSRVVRPVARPLAAAVPAPLASSLAATLPAAPPSAPHPSVATAPHRAPARATAVAVPSSLAEPAPSSAKPKRAIY